MNEPNVIGAREAAGIAGVSHRRILALLRQGRIPGAHQVSGVWMIPRDFTIKKAERNRPGKITFR